MQENLKQVKRSKTLNVIVICLLLVLFTASVFLAVIAPVFTSNSVASAYDATLPDDGFVGDNLAYNSDFSINTSGTSSWTSNGSAVLTVDGWYLFNGSASYSNAVPRINLDSTQVGNRYSRFFSRNLQLSSGTYTFTCCYNYVSGGGTSRFRVNNAVASSFDNFSGSTYVDLVATSGVHISTFTITFGSDYKVNFDFYSSASSSGFIADLYWVKVEVGSFFTGYMPDYQKQIDDLQTKYDDLQSKYNDLQNKYDDYVSESNFNYLSTVSLENAYYFNQNVPERSGTSSYTFGPNASDNSLPDVERNFTCPVYGFYSNTIYRRYLFGVQLPYEIPAGSTIKLDYTCFCVGSSFTGVPFSELWRLGYTYAFFFGQYGYPTIDEPGQMVVVDAFNNANGDIYVKVNQPTSYVAFDVVLRTDNTQRLSGYFSVSDSGVFSLHTDSSLGHQWFLAFNTLNVYYQGDMLASAVDSAKKEGYNQGYQEGKVAGREVGYQEGLKDNGDYTFMGLLGAVFDAPIQAFKGLLSFEVLGVNMTAFVSSLFGLCIILLIIKLILGGK